MNIKMFEAASKFKLLLIAVLAFIVCYLIPNHFGFIKATNLYLFNFETKIPFISWTVWIYMSDYVYVVLAFMLLKEKININKAFYSFLFFCVSSMLVFYIYPTTFPRPVVEYVGVNGILLKLLHNIDTPNNCFPSLHVGMSFLLSYFYLYEQKKYFPLFFLWSILISLSTLSTKQHYFVDILGGIILSIVSFYVINKFLFKKKKNLTFILLKNV